MKPWFLNDTWRLTVLASSSVLALAGCGLTGNRTDPKVASERAFVTPGASAPSQGAKPIDRPSGVEREPSSPVQIAALHRLDRAKTLIAKGDFLPAISDLEKTLAMDSTNPHTYLYLARAHHGLGNFRESLNFLEVAESLFEDGNASLAEVWRLEGDNLRDLGQLSQAQQSYERASRFRRN